MGNETVITIARTVDAKDVNTSKHSLRVSEYSVLIAKELGYSDEECENLRKAALLHDIGKIGIPDRILNKPERLTDEEYAVMKSHVEKEQRYLKALHLLIMLKKERCIIMKDMTAKDICTGLRVKRYLLMQGLSV